MAEQLALQDPSMRSPTSYRIVRQKAANYMRSPPDEFKWFLDDSTDFEDYCNKVENSNGMCYLSIMMVEWGGQLELRALSIALQRPIHVYSADSPVVIMGEDIAVCVLVICFV